MCSRPQVATLTPPTPKDNGKGKSDGVITPPTTPKSPTDAERWRPVAGLIAAGDVRAAQKALDDLPAETAGLKGFDASSWFGLLAPAGTPADIITRIQQETAKALASPAVKEKLLAQGAIPGGNTPQEFAKMIDAEHIKWAGVVKASGAKVD